MRTPSCGLSKAETGVGTVWPPPPMIMCTVPSEVSIRVGSLDCGAGVSSVLPGKMPRTGKLRSKWCSWPATTRSTPYLSNSGSHACRMPRSAPLKWADVIVGGGALQFALQPRLLGPVAVPHDVGVVAVGRVVRHVVPAVRAEGPVL